ncbi:MAG: alanine--tRNA ligase [Immundisolibacteraceae bacterium]|nr:alanine--tRNA ligase [Immundisolibacteraceae bacterium]
MADFKTSRALREAFLDYFAERGHQRVESASLVPVNDPTLLFTNAGMVPFKELFLGHEDRGYLRATSSQRCVRAGGKHNDLENVGYTARHHTFFEMLGNFSFGDYFKTDAIRFAWEFLTEVVGLPAEKLWITIFKEDDEAARIWLDEVGVDPARFSRIGAKDNFWSMGDTGPCGPCTEIFYDHGEKIAGGPPGTPEEDGDRYVEIWNLVFMQYDRQTDGSLVPLPKPSVDTGMGLERLAAIMQGVHDNFDTDLFVPLIESAAKIIGVAADDSRSLRVVADHIRSCAFLLIDGVVPSNEGRGYVLRRIIRRAARHGSRLGATEPFFYRLVEPLITVLGDAYPELAEQRSRVEEQLKLEEERFALTLEQGLQILEREMADLGGDVLPGELLFRLYDTYGFPVDLTADIARERGLQVDMEGFESHMAEQRKRARAGGSFNAQTSVSVDLELVSEFTGYENTEDGAEVIALYREGEPVESVAAGDEAMVILNQSPFYAEAGGQVGDRGVLLQDDVRFQVEDTRKYGNAIGHLGKVVAGELSLGGFLQAQVDQPRRSATARNHSATHLLHAALRQLLGDHISQKGSLVDDQRLRFDFSHDQPVTPAQLSAIETLVNDQVRRNAPVSTQEMSIDDARQLGAMALFGEKYGDQVRVVGMDDFSIELCGGTHASQSGDIGYFKIIAETGVAAGVRRIEAVTGAEAVAWVSDQERLLTELANQLQTSTDQLESKVSALLAQNRDLGREVEKLKSQSAAQASADLHEQAITVNDVKVLAVVLEQEPKTLRETADRLKDKLGQCVLLLATVNGGKVNLVAAVSKDLTDRLSAGELVNLAAQKVGGKGGGRPDMAMAGGKDPSGVEAALELPAQWVAEKL